MELRKFIATTIREYLNEQQMLNESMENKILYHGSPHNFQEFNKKYTFFSETYNFAYNYATQKSQDYGLDQSPIVYTVKVKGNIFDINNKVDFDKLKKELPEEIEYSYNNFGFKTKENKDEFLQNLKGFETVIPIEYLQNLKVGEEFPSPEYKNDKFIVYKINKDYLYYYTKDSFNRIGVKNTDKYSDIFKPLYNFLKDDIMENNPDTKYIDDTDIKYSLQTFITNANYGHYKKPNQNKLIEFHELYKEFNKKIIDILIEKDYIYKFNLKPVIVKLKDTWRFYENDILTSIIEKLGYSGYVALERGVNTYLIFNPSKSVKIIDKKEY